MHTQTGQARTLLSSKNVGLEIGDMLVRVLTPFSANVSATFDLMLHRKFKSQQEELEKSRKKLLTKTRLNLTLDISLKEAEELRQRHIEAAVTDTDLMKAYLPSYSVHTGWRILNSLQPAWDKYCFRQEGQWGPGIIAKESTLNRSVVSRYLGAFVRAGITEYLGIHIPHRFHEK